MVKKSRSTKSRLLPCGRKAAHRDSAPTEEKFQVWKQRLKSYLAGHELRYTEQRWKIAEIILSTGGHLTALELVDQVHRAHSEIGAATVYRNLKVLCDADILKESLTDAEGRVTYELFDEVHHDHIVCMDCGEIFEFHNEKIEAEQNRITDKLSFAPVRHRHVIYARCQWGQREPAPFG